MGTLIVGRGPWNRFFAEEFVLFGDVMARVDVIAAETDEVDLEVPC